MASPPPLALLVISIFFSSSLFGCVFSHRAITAELFHRSSLNNSVTVPEKVRAAVRRSVELAQYWASLAGTNDSIGESKFSLPAGLRPATFEYLMEISLGTPPVTVLGVPSTSSDLIWTKCAPCRGCTHKNFNVRRSSSYRHISCDSRPCASLHRLARCGRRRSCQYAVVYGDGSFTLGSLSRDTFTFNSTTRRKISFPRVVFGCTRTMVGTFNTGIIGLGKGPLSLISQLRRAVGGRFSYCLVPITERGSSGFFKLGGAPAVGGAGAVTIPIVSPRKSFPPSSYYLPLQEISIGSVRIPAEMDIFIDSSTAVTMLPEVVVRALEVELRNQIHAPLVRDPEGQFDLCFRVGTSPWVAAAFPEIVFGFVGGRVTLKPVNIFMPTENGVKCLGITTSPNPAFAVFGFFAQQNFHVEYDLEKNTVTLAPANCARLRRRG